MRSIFLANVWTSALTQRLASPFLALPLSSLATRKPTANSDWHESLNHAPQSNAEFADAAVRFCRTLW